MLYLWACWETRRLCSSFRDGQCAMWSPLSLQQEKSTGCNVVESASRDASKSAGSVYWHILVWVSLTGSEWTRYLEILSTLGSHSSHAHMRERTNRIWTTVRYKRTSSRNVFRMCGMNKVLVCGKEETDFLLTFEFMLRAPFYYTSVVQSSK